MRWQPIHLLPVMVVLVAMDVALSPRNRIKLCASPHDTATPEQSPGPTMEDLDTPAPHNGEDLDFIDSICNQFDVDLETLYAHAAKHHTGHTEVNKQGKAHALETSQGFNPSTW